MDNNRFFLKESDDNGKIKPLTCLAKAGARMFMVPQIPALHRFNPIHNSPDEASSCTD